MKVGGLAVGPSFTTTSVESISRLVQVTAGTAITVVDPNASMEDSIAVGAEITIVRIA